MEISPICSHPNRTADILTLPQASEKLYNPENDEHCLNCLKCGCLVVLSQKDSSQLAAISVADLFMQDAYRLCLCCKIYAKCMEHNKRVRAARAQARCSM